MSSEKKMSTEFVVKEPGTIIDGRYRISSQVGHGGFSIVYDAVNIHTGKRVAIKECTDRQVRNNFLREARLLKDFSDEEAIVSVLDYFEDEETAFIVMEYLDGITLGGHIERNGKLDMEEAVRLFSPVMKTLERMHSKGVIHRDISPDNIMMLSDGTLRLLDFGAAREYVDSKVSRLVYKANYSPPEQRDEAGNVGSWSDVYSICATIYYCISGRVPEDVVSRLLYDELKKPSDMGISILPAAEKILMQGMEPDSARRVRSMDRLRNELEKCYPVMSEEEKAAIARKKKRRKVISISLIPVVIAGICVLVNIYRLQILFNLTDTYTFKLDGSSMTDEQYKVNSRKARDRIKAMSGGKYIIEEKNKKITFEVPASIFYDESPEMFTEASVARKQELYLCTLNEDGSVKPVEKLSQSGDIDDVYTSDGKVIVSFTPDAQKKYGEYLRSKSMPLVLCLDVEKDYILGSYILTNGDGRTVTVDESREEHELNLDLLKEELTVDPLDKSFAMEMKWDVKWEDPESSLMKGKNQVSFSELTADSGKTILCMKYDRDITGSKTDDDKLDAAYFQMQALMKNRMDAMGVPYAVGSINHEDGKIVIAAEDSNVFCEMGNRLGLDQAEYDFYNIGSRFASENVSHQTWKFAIDSDGIRMELQPSDKDENKKEILSLLKRIRKQGEKEVFVYWRGMPVAGAEISRLIDEAEKYETLTFDKWCLSEKAQGKESVFADFINSSLEQEAGNSNEYVIRAVQALSSKGKRITREYEAPYYFEASEQANKHVKELRKKSGRQISVLLDDEKGQADDITLDAAFFCDEKASHDEGIKALTAFYKENKAMLTDGTFKVIALRIFDSDEAMKKNANGMITDNLSTVNIIIKPDIGSGKYCVDFISCEGNEKLAEQIKKEFKEDPELSEMITAETEVWK